MVRPEQSLGELELEVLKVIWEIQPCTVQEVADVLGERRGSARTTVLTVMQRLRAKGYLTRRKREGVYRYSPTEERRTVIARLIARFVTDVLDGSALPFVAYLAESRGLTEEEAAALRGIVRDLERKLGEGEQ